MKITCVTSARSRTEMSLPALLALVLHGCFKALSQRDSQAQRRLSLPPVTKAWSLWILGMGESSWMAASF